ncbi:MAG TPA: exo-alpha-sialidase [Bacteroidota bacterium]|nr:exo-alpha-sialidase [Bacteroidota bacterium]
MCRAALILLLASACSISPAFAQPANIRINPKVSGDFYPPEEVSVAINPLAPANVVVGANVRYAYVSIDSGKTWTEHLLPLGTWGDPSLAFDARGGLYFGHLFYLNLAGNTPGAYFIDRIGVHRSTDGGMTWKDSAQIGHNPPKQQDKDWVTADLSDSPYRNSVYLAWTQFDAYGSRAPADSSRILFSRSTDGGATWSAPLRVSDRAGDCVDSSNTVEGAVPAVGPNGEVYLCWGGPLGIMSGRSTDGGVTWGRNVFVDSLPGGWDQQVSGIYRCNGMPVTACDISTSPWRGTVYVCWSDKRRGPGNACIFLRRSTDGGATWRPAVQVNTDETLREHFFPWMTVDPSTGVVYVVFYDRRETAGDATDVYVARSTDGGATFTDARVSASSFIPDASVFFGDYTGIAARGGSVYPVWMRMDAGSLSVWTAPYTEPPAVVPPPSAPTAYTLSQNYPNPFNPSTTITYTVPAPAFVRLAVYDLLGRQVAVLAEGASPTGTYRAVFNASQLASGVYYCRLTAPGYAAERAMLHVK